MLPETFQISHRDISVGKNVRLSSSSNLYECTLGDFVFVGPFVEIQKGVKVGNNSKIQSHSFICELVEIGSDCFIGHGVMFINDLLKEGPANSDKTKWAKTIISDRVYIGSNSTVLPVEICSDVTIGAGSVVTRDIKVPGTYIGNPAKRITR
jgi:acetyltransferase-like isoleucine patch superfamily enzyme